MVTQVFKTFSPYLRAHHHVKFLFPKIGTKTLHFPATLPARGETLEWTQWFPILAEAT